MTSTYDLSVGDATFSIETGRLAQQANGSVLMRHGDSVALVTATMSNPREGIDFFPLTIDFEERLYARGKIPGSFFRREGRPSTEAVLIDRLTDRPLRPLFPKGFKNEVQIIITSMSADQENPLDILTIVGASTALCISDIPFNGPIGATRIGYLDGELVVNPTFAQLEESDLDLVVAGNRDGVMMMEAGATELSEDLVFEAIKVAQEVNLEVIAFQDQIIADVGKTKVPFEAPKPPAGLEAAVARSVDGRLSSALDVSDGKDAQTARHDSLKAEVIEALSDEFEERDISLAFRSAVDEAVRDRILNQSLRPDGRDLQEIRPISGEVGILPRTHGNGLFNRGETQVLGIATLGSVGDAQRLDNLNPRESKRFLLHYNFPPYSVGETRRIFGPGRREVGHGALAERAIVPVLPSVEDFPYTIRLVSEVLSSNGSTSMASVCACILALMDAGVPITRPVAGISVGLITDEAGKWVTLTDIQGVEDHIGDMDFKVAGTVDGITAIQLDIKVSNIGFDVIEAALEQARKARLFLLDRMSETIGETRSDVSRFAPKMLRLQIPVSKIGSVIGPSGKTIRAIIEETGATVDIEDDGSVFIGSPDRDAAEKAMNIIRQMTREIEVGEIFTGRVVKILPFGAFVELTPGKDGLVHISELENYRVDTVEDVVDIGDEVTVIVKEIDSQGRINLSRKALMTDDSDNGDGADGPGADRPEQARSGDSRPQRGPRPDGDRGGPPRGRQGGGGGRPPGRGGRPGGGGGQGGRRPFGRPRG